MSEMLHLDISLGSLIHLSGLKVPSVSKRDKLDFQPNVFCTYHTYRCMRLYPLHPHIPIPLVYDFEMILKYIPWASVGEVKMCGMASGVLKPYLGNHGHGMR